MLIQKEGGKIMAFFLKSICSILIVITIIFSIGCSSHNVDTVGEWCEQLAGVDLNKKYAPFWAVLPSVSFDGDAIRDDFTTSLNETYLQKAENRAPRMAWREGTELHLINLSTLFVIEPEEFIGKWREGIELRNELKLTDEGDLCIYGTLTTMFDSLHIHSIEIDELGKEKADNVTVISTGREKRLGNNRL
jgi:hypothetical protein